MSDGCKDFRDLLPAERYGLAIRRMAGWPLALTIHNVGDRPSRVDSSKRVYAIEFEEVPMATNSPVFTPQFFASLLPALSPALASFGGALIGQFAPGNPQIQADAQALVSDALKLAVDVIAAKAAAAVVVAKPA